MASWSSFRQARSSLSLKIQHLSSSLPNSFKNLYGSCKIEKTFPVDVMGLHSQFFGQEVSSRGMQQSCTFSTGFRTWRKLEPRWQAVGMRRAHGSMSWQNQRRLPGSRSAGRQPQIQAAAQWESPGSSNLRPGQGQPTYGVDPSRQLRPSSPYGPGASRPHEMGPKVLPQPTVARQVEAVAPPSVQQAPPKTSWDFRRYQHGNVQQYGAERSPVHGHIEPSAPGPFRTAVDPRHGINGSNGRLNGAPLNGAPGTPLPQFTPQPLFQVDGIVKTITMHNKETGYIVARVKPRSHVPSDKLSFRGMLTVVGNHKDMAVGQQVSIEGKWAVHNKYGPQLQIESIFGVELSSKEKAVNMLRGASLPGVGPATAERIADHFEDELEEVMNSPDAARQLAKVHKVGPKTAQRIKDAWDSTRGERETAQFIQDLGLQGVLVQRIMKRHGTAAREKVSKDPYHALHGITGIDLRKTENVAVQLRLEGHESWTSRAVMAMNDVLLESSRQYGHIFIPWQELEANTLKHLQSSGMIWKGGPLKPCAEKAAKWRKVVVETGPVDETCIERVTASPAEARKKVDKSLREYLKTRLKQVGDVRAQILVDTFGSDIFEMLRGQNAVKDLQKVKGIIEIVAKEIKESWDKNQFKRPEWVSPVPSLRLLPKYEREESNDAKDFELEVPHVEILPTSRLYHPEMHAAESTIARELARLAAAPKKTIPRYNIPKWILGHENDEGMKLSDGQREAVIAAMRAPVMILTGGPGCGKTQATATIVKLWCSMGCVNFKLAAPTGRASQRLQEVAKQPSSTIHRLLKYISASSKNDPTNDDEDVEGTYTYNYDNPLEADAVLVDEAAMLDITLAAALLEALKAGTQLILVGDVDQLAPVGPGTVLSAAIQSGMIPVIDLREMFRQAQESQIVTAAHAIQRGHFPDIAVLPPAMLESPSNQPLVSDAMWVKADKADGSAMQDMVKAVIENVILPRGFIPAFDLQVLSPMRRGTVGVEALNQQLQQLLNPPAPPGATPIPEIAKRKSSPDSAVFRLGDRVIQTKNNYKNQIFNGDLGFIQNIDIPNRSVLVEFPETDMEKFYGDDGKGSPVKTIEYPASSLWELDLAWATTVHKAQGGEAPIVILTLHHGHRNLLTRRLLYTAVTRAKQLVIIVGPEGAIRKAVEEIHGDKRLSSLRERLQVHATAKGVFPIDPKLFGPPTAGPSPIEINANDTQSVQQLAKQVPILAASELALDAAAGNNHPSNVVPENPQGNLAGQPGPPVPQGASYGADNLSPPVQRTTTQYDLGPASNRMAQSANQSKKQKVKDLHKNGSRRAQRSGSGMPNGAGRPTNTRSASSYYNAGQPLPSSPGDPVMDLQMSHEIDMTAEHPQRAESPPSDNDRNAEGQNPLILNEQSTLPGNEYTPASQTQNGQPLSYGDQQHSNQAGLDQHNGHSAQVQPSPSQSSGSDQAQNLQHQQPETPVGSHTFTGPRRVWRRSIIHQ